MTEEHFEKLGQHLTRVEADVKKIAQLRGYTTVLLPPYSGNQPRIKLLKMENGYSYFITLIMESSPEEKAYTSFFEEIPYYLKASIKGTKNKHDPFELYDHKAFNQIEKTFLGDLLQCDFRLESYKDGVDQGTINTPDNFPESNNPCKSLKKMDESIKKFSKIFNYKYEYEINPIDDLPKVKFFKKINDVFFHISLRPNTSVGDRFEFSDEFDYTLRYSTSHYEDDRNGNLVQCCYTDAILYEKKPFKEISKSFYEDLLYCDKSIMSEDFECLKIK